MSAFIVLFNSPEPTYFIGRKFQQNRFIISLYELNTNQIQEQYLRN